MQNQEDKISLVDYNISYAVEKFWATNRSFPGIEVLQEETGYSFETISSALKSDGLKKRFEVLGIDSNANPVIKGETSRNKTRLTDKQLAVAMTLLNPLDGRGLRTKLDALGVAPATYKGWTKNRVFSDFMREQSEAMLGESLPLAHRALISKVMQGDMKAIKMLYEITGRWSGQNAASEQNLKVVVARLIEIIQRYVTSPETLQAIASDFKEVMNPTPPVASAEVINGYVEIGS